MLIEHALGEARVFRTSCRRSHFRALIQCNQIYSAKNKPKPTGKIMARTTVWLGRHDCAVSNTLRTFRLIWRKRFRNLHLLWRWPPNISRSNSSLSNNSMRLRSCSTNVQSCRKWSLATKQRFPMTNSSTFCQSFATITQPDLGESCGFASDTIHVKTLRAVTSSSWTIVCEHIQE